MEYRGNPVSPGYASGKVYLYRPNSPVVETRLIGAGQRAAVVGRYEAAKAGAKAELERIRDKLMLEDESKAKIFSAQMDLLCDVAIDQEIREKISDELQDVECSVFDVFNKYARILEKSGNPLFRERAQDLEDVRNRLLRCCSGRAEQTLADLRGQVIVVAHDLLPSDTANLDRSKVLAIVTEAGGGTSHSAILARCYGIPAVLGAIGITEALRDGEDVLVDAVEGVILTAPDGIQMREWDEKRSEFLKKTEAAKRHLEGEPLTADGVRIDVYLNIASAEPAELDAARHADGVGLLRTEFLYMESDHLPTEEEQFALYKKVLLAFGGRPVTLRTLDIGGDKTLPYFTLPNESNPFLGERAFRLCVSHRELFRPQLRAALRASVYGNLWIMFPMIGSLDDIRRAKEELNQVRIELSEEGIPFADNVKTGIMIEIPAIAVLADHAAREVDFASIGSNDLIQYLSAADRMNPAVSEYYQAYNPAVFRLIGHVAEQFQSAGKPVSVCGELGGDPLAAALLVGLGLRKLSMSASALAGIKRMLAGLTISEAQKFARKACAMSTAAEVEQYLRSALHA